MSYRTWRRAYLEYLLFTGCYPHDQRGAADAENCASMASQLRAEMTGAIPDIRRDGLNVGSHCRHTGGRREG
jgi:hypothetical protein